MFILFEFEWRMCRDRQFLIAFWSFSFKCNTFRLLFSTMSVCCLYLWCTWIGAFSADCVQFARTVCILTATVKPTFIRYWLLFLTTIKRIKQIVENVCVCVCVYLNKPTWPRPFAISVRLVLVDCFVYTECKRWWVERMHPANSDDHHFHENGGQWSST